MRRIDLQKLAEAKLSDARILLDHGRFGNAYYLSGYAVEIGLKACIARKIFAEVIPDKAFINGIYSHDLDKLAGFGGLAAELKQERDRNRNFGSNWLVVSEWRPEARYESTDSDAAGLMLAAVGSETNGVLQWIKAYW